MEHICFEPGAGYFRATDINRNGMNESSHKTGGGMTHFPKGSSLIIRDKNNDTVKIVPG